MRELRVNRPLRVFSDTKVGNLVSIYAGTTISENVFIDDHASIRNNVSIEEWIIYSWR